MHQSRLFLCLKTLSLKEWQKLEEYVLSPFFNKNEKIVIFFSLLKTEAFDLDSPNLEKSILMCKLFSENEKSASNLGNLMTQFLNTVYDFWHLCYIKDKKENVSRWVAILNTLQEKGLSKIWMSNYNKWKKEDKKHQIQDVTYFYNKYLILECVYGFTIDYSKEKIEVDLQEVTNAFETYVIFNNLKYCCNMLNSSQFRQLDTSKALIENITNRINEKNLSDIPSIKLYYTAFLMLKYPNEVGYFRELNDLLSKKESKKSPISYLPKDEALDIYTFALNYCIGKIVKGELNYYREMFDLYKHILNENLFDKQLENSNEKYIDANHIKNIVTLGLRLKETEWTKQFVENNKRKVLPDLQEDCYKFNMANIYFQEKQYDNVLEVLRDIEYINYFYQVDCRVLLLKTYYETKNSELLLFLSDTFRKQLDNNKLSLSKNRKNAYKNFNTYLLKLSKLRNKGTRKKICLELAKLNENIENTQDFSDKQWLFEKIAALQKRHKCETKTY